MGGDDNDIGPEPTEQEEEVCFDFYTNELIVQRWKEMLLANEICRMIDCSCLPETFGQRK